VDDGRRLTRLSASSLIASVCRFVTSVSFASSVVGWDKDFPALTLSALQNKRTEFWDTRVQGRAECWQAIRVAVEAAESDGDSSTTQAILESAEMTPFDIERSDVCFTYDSKGFKYEIPLYCLYLPSNLLRDPPVKPASHSPLQVQPAPPKAVSSASDALDAEIKQPEALNAGTGKSLKFKVRFSTGLSDLAIEQRTSCSIGQLKALIHAKHADLAPERIRIYYLGKYMSHDKWNLGEIGMKKEMVRRTDKHAIVYGREV
jgi:hypothetical protein